MHGIGVRLGTSVAEVILEQGDYRRVARGEQLRRRCDQTAVRLVRFFIQPAACSHRVVVPDADNTWREFPVVLIDVEFHMPGRLSVRRSHQTTALLENLLSRVFT